MELSDNHIHIWKLDLKNKEIDLNHFHENVLSTDEKNRADRLKSKVDRRRSVSSRGLLRTKLGEYLELDPSKINFSYNKYGKPSLDTKYHKENLKFNVSHSRDIVVYAITRSRDIGIDVEYLKTVNKADQIVERFFSEEEKIFYNSQTVDKKEWAFFTLWTRKEAYSKAMGRGIGLPAKDFDIELIPYHNPNAAKKSEWTLYNVDIHSNYLAALATQGDSLEIRHCDVDTIL